MCNATVLIGLLGQADYDGAKRIVSEACSAAAINLTDRDLALLESHQCTAIGFEDVTLGESLVQEFFSLCDGTDLGAAGCYAFVLIFAKGDANDAKIPLTRIFGDLVARIDLQEQAIDTQVYVTMDFYRQLPPDQQDKYKPGVVVAKNHVHQRYGRETMKCFVISPIGEEGSAVRQRADHVFDTYIKPACDSTDFMAIRGDHMVGPDIMEDIKHALQTWPMAIAYLGDLRNGINQNVLYELGQRSAIELPVVMLRDRWGPEEDADADTVPELPFDLIQSRCVDLPSEDEEDLNDSVASGKAAGVIRTIRLRLQEYKKFDAGWKAPFPVATFYVQGGRCRCVDGTDDLKDFFDVPNPVGRDLDDILPRLMEKMPKSQQEPFHADQRTILGNVIHDFPKALRDHRLVPHIPLVFQEHPSLRGRAFLPVMFRYANIGNNITKLRIGYIDVTGATRRRDDGVYISVLGSTSDAIVEGLNLSD